MFDQKLNVLTVVYSVLQLWNYTKQLFASGSVNMININLASGPENIQQYSLRLGRMILNSKNVIIDNSRKYRFNLGNILGVKIIHKTWKLIMREGTTANQSRISLGNHHSFVLRKTLHGNHIIMVNSSFPNSPVCKAFSISQLNTDRFRKGPFSCRINVDGRPHPRNGVASSNSSVLY